MTKKKEHHILRRLLSIPTAALILWQGGIATAANAVVPERSAVPYAVTEIEKSTYSRWKQYAAAWANLPVGKMGGNMKSIGCAVTSAAILCAASHSAIPEGFDPGVLCDFLTKNEGFSTHGDLQWLAITKLVPDFKYVTTKAFNSKIQREQVEQLAAYLDDGYYVAIMLQKPDYVENGVTIKGSTHFVAVDRVQNGIVYIHDPASNYDTLYGEYTASMMVSMRLFRGGDSPAQTPTEQPEDQPTGAYLTTDRLNLRANAGTDHTVLLVIPSETRIDITEVTGGWGKTTYDGQTGWVSMRYCTPAVAMFTAGDYCTDQQTLTLHSAPTADSDALGSLPPDTIITVTEINGDWGYCSYNGLAGWVSLRYCSSNEGNANAGIVYRYTTGANKMRLRANATTDSGILALLPTNTEFTVTDIEGNWGKTVYNAQVGWIYLPYCTLIADDTPNTSDPTEPDVPDTPTETVRHLYTTGTNTLRLRAEANDTSDTLAYITADTELLVTEINGEWGKTIYKEKTGWVYLGYCTLLESNVSENDTPASQWPANVGTCVVIATSLNVRVAADINGTWLGSAAYGEQLTVLQTNGDWAKISWQNSEGWVCMGQYGTPYLYLVGDVTMDGHVDDGDHKLMDAFFSGVALPDAVQMLIADINNDGTVNETDRALLTEKGENI